MSLSRSSSSTNSQGLVLRAGIVASLLLVLPSCCIPKLQGPDPAAPMPVNFTANSTECTTLIAWHEFFNDPSLIGLIDQALDGNQELRILDQRVAAANFEILARRGAYLPFVFGRAGAGLEKPGQFTPLGAVEDQLEVRPGEPFPDPLPDFLVAADVSWEVDIWRKLRNARDAAGLRYLGTAEGRNYVVTRLVAEVAEHYYELMALDNRMATLDRTIQIQQQSLEVAKARKEAGRDTELPVQRFQAEVRKNQSEKLIIAQEIVEVENRINFLLGRFPQQVARNSAIFMDLTLLMPNIGLPSQLLQNRSDVRQAERELAAAGLDVRVARANFFPSLNLRAGVGYEAFNPRYLFNTPESLMYNVAGDLVAPLINKKGIQAEYLTANAEQLEKLYEYQKTVLNAFTEVINRMAKVENYRQSIQIKQLQLLALDASVDTATKLFQSGRTEYMDVLFSQRDLMEARMVLIETKQQQLAAVINTYQALGGGGSRVGGGPRNGAVYVEPPPAEVIAVPPPLEGPQADPRDLDPVPPPGAPQPGQHPPGTDPLPMPDPNVPRQGKPTGPRLPILTGGPPARQGQRG